MYGGPWQGDGKEKCRQTVENQTAGEVIPATDNNIEIKVFIGKHTGIDTNAQVFSIVCFLLPKISTGQILALKETTSTLIYLH